MDPFVDFEVFTSCKQLFTDFTNERSFSRMDSDVIDKFVLGLESLGSPGTAFPSTNVLCELRASHVL